ncbi:MAG: hypothetical protein HKM89_09925 [Gemmatimonadales bacterium]|nr:hypothetical protein [Gemmatimonadales bacterium]
MPSSPDPTSLRRGPFGRRNLFLLGAALLSLTIGYGLLMSGRASTAAVFLVLGYCVLFPLGIAL